MRSPALVNTMIDSDEGIYAFVASQWRQGHEPYRDLFDHKPPLVHIAYRFAFAAFGESMVSPRLVWTLAVALTSVGCAAVVRRLRGAWLPPIVAGVAAAIFLGSPLVEGETANTETLMVLATTWAAFFGCAAAGARGLSSAAAALAGLCAGVSLLAKPVALVEAAFLAAWIVYFSPRRGRDLVAFSLAALAPALAWGVYAVVQGSIWKMYEDVVQYNLHYASSGKAPWLARLALLAADHGLPLALLWAGVGLCLLTSLRTERRAPDFALGWTVAALIGALSAGRLYEHYFQQIVPPMAVALGVAVASLTPRLQRPLVRVAAIAVFTLGLWPPIGARLRLPSAATGCPSWQDRLAELVRQGTSDDDRLVVWGYEPYIHFASRRLPPGPYFYKYPLLGEGAAAVQARERLRAATAERPTAVVVVLKGELTAEPSGTPETEILSPEAPFHWLIEGSPVLDAPNFLLYTSPALHAQPWQQRWLDLFRQQCGNGPARP
jgi:4-amino-4-deoxy-L-arabinose transferase-like glycosyltransferase